MPVSCKICNAEFSKLISSTHLKKHNITSQEYKVQYGKESLTSPEYRQERSIASSGTNNPNYGNKLSESAKTAISQANSGKTAWNKGLSCPDSTKQAISDANKGRQSWNKGLHHTVETKEKIKKARKKQIITAESIQKAIETKKKNGYDLAFFRGKTHTPESREKISKSSKLTAENKRQMSLIRAQKQLDSIGYTLIDTNNSVANIVCDRNHAFSITRQYLTDSKFRQELCPICHPREIVVSQAELELRNFISSLTAIKTNVRTIIPPLELDIVVEDKKIAFEYNGLYWHSEKFKDRYYHQHKMQECNQRGFKLIQLFEDEWANHREIVESRICSYLGVNKRIYARHCDIEKISSHEAGIFLNNNHIQGNGRANCHYGLRLNNELVAVMTFLNSDISKQVKGWELNRYASLLNTNIIGGASKLFKKFIKDHNPNTVTTFADLRWSNTSTFYESLGFVLEHTSAPNYWYVYPNELIRKHRYSLRKPKNSELTERELRSEQGYYRIYDCGSNRYTWTQKSPN